MTGYRDPRWGKGSLGAFVVAVLLMIWLAIPPTLFLDYRSMAITKNDEGQWMMISVRDTPVASAVKDIPILDSLFGHVVATWRAELRVIGREDGQTCHGGGQAVYEPSDSGVVRYVIREWGVPCLEAGPPTSVIFERQVWVLGLIPLRSMVYSFPINPETAPIISTP